MNIIENKIIEIYDSSFYNDSNKKTVFIFEGFKNNSLSILDNKFFDKDFITINNLEEGYDSTYILTQSMNNISNSSAKFWMTVEEFIISQNKIEDLFNFVVVKNNLYNKFYPYQNTIENIDENYEKFYFDLAKTIEKNDEKDYETISKYYGDIIYSKDYSNYYISYAVEYNDDTIFVDIFDNISLINEVKDKTNISIETPLVELTEDETILLNITSGLLNNKVNYRKIAFVIMSDIKELPNKYLERVSILKSLLENQVDLFFIRKELSVLDKNKLIKYEKLLSKYWGYDNFRDLEMYEDVKSNNRKIVKISQGQIINDIVEQAEKALINETNKDYRDIFITSATGSGKSIMFQLPTIYLREKYKEIKPFVIVISPLIALMEDQVNSLKDKNINIARTINSNTDGYKREQILDEINNGDCSMLYISPETLQSKSDIKLLIGERRLALVIIDEAHIVTTWGKSFRADYWYLGIYLQKLRKQFDFPIVTFTATAIFGGKEDMYLETRDSLNMINPISYFGKIKRNDITMIVNSTDQEYENYAKDYKNAKNNLLLNKLKKWFEKKEKALVYFPTVFDLNEFYAFLNNNCPEIGKITGKYNGQLGKDERNIVLEEFRIDKLKFVLATKAFGMGVDIPNIVHVYHYNPSGTVTDYVQEIGRVARDHDLVKMGFAHCDFFKYDFVAIERLQGMSRIKKYELLEVMDKIKKIYENKGHNRNLLIKTEDFKYIFSKTKKEDSDSDLDNKVKTALLLIEKDFSSPKKIGYSPFVARPRGYYGKDLILVNDEILKDLKNSILENYIEPRLFFESGYYTGVYLIDLSKLWEDKYKKLSFPNFKRIIYTRNQEELNSLVGGGIFNKLVYATILKIDNFKTDDIFDKINIFNKYIDVFSSFLANKKRNDKYFNISELQSYLSKNLRIKSNVKARAISQTLINACLDYQKSKNYNFIKERTDSEILYQLIQSYDIFIDFCKDNFRNFLINEDRRIIKDNSLRKAYTRSGKNVSKLSLDLIVLSIAENLELISYTTENGYSPEIYIRMNSIYPIEKAIKNEKKYKNYILADIYDRHHLNIAMLTYLFKYKVDASNKKERVIKYTEFFWDKIEDYFLGIVPEEVLEKLNER